MIRGDSRRKAMEKLHAKLQVEKSRCSSVSQKAKKPKKSNFEKIPLSEYSPEAEGQSKRMKKLFARTRSGFAQSQGSQATLMGIKLKKNKRIAEMQLLAKREWYEIWNQNDMAKLFLIEIFNLGNRIDKQRAGAKKQVKV